MNSKHITESKTFWFNLAVAILPLLGENLDLVKDYLSDGGYLAYMCLVSAGNVYLRSITNSPVTVIK